MQIFKSLVLAVALSAAGCLSSAFASPWMKIGARTSQPYGHYDFCKRHATECQPLKAAEPEALTPESWRTILSVNNAVNTEIEQRTDMEVWGYEDYWEYPYKGAGDCDDIVLEKRRRLIQAGIPARNLPITVVRDEQGDGHAVLTVITDRGDFILDNLRAKVLRWDETPYTYLKRQSTRNAGHWQTITPSDGPAVASVAGSEETVPASTRK